MKISVCFVIKNGVKQGYPFWESLESCIPFADEIVISEGYSDDGTADYIAEFSNRHPGLVKVFKDDWSTVKSGHGEVIAVISNKNISRCSGEWIYYLQADEIIPDENHSFIKDIAENHSSEFNSVSFPFWHFIGGWKPLPKKAAYDEAIRMIKNSPDIHLVGDAWTFGGEVTPTCPAGLSPKPVYHLAWVFPGNNNYKRIEHGKIYSEIDGYQKAAEEGRRGIKEGNPTEGLPIDEDFNDFPDRIRHLVGQASYKLPVEL